MKPSLKFVAASTLFIAPAIVIFASFLIGSASGAAPKKAAAPVAAAPAVLKSIGNPSAPQGGTFAINLDIEPETLNPITSTDLYGQEVHKLVMDTLLYEDLETHDWRPAVAEKYEVSADGKQITFTIRKGLKFQDGQPLTAEDVKFSFDVIMSGDYATAQAKPYYENIEKAVIVDPQTVRFDVKTKYFGNLEQLATLTIVPKHLYQNATEGKKLNRTLIGSGPYKIEKYDQGQFMLLVKNKDWWGNSVEAEKGHYNFEHIRFRFLKDSNISIEAMKKGDIDFGGLTAEEYTKKTSDAAWGKTVMKVKTENLTPKSYGYIGWNLRHDLFKSRKVRLALYELMNREEMNQKFQFGMSLLATGPWYQQSEYADPSVKPVKFDPKDAVRLLKEEGWADTDKDGMLDKVVNGQKQNLSFTLTYGSKDTEKYWVLYQSDLRKVGIEMKLQMLEWNAIMKNIDESNFDAAALGWGAGSIDVDPKQIWHSSSAVKGGSNHIGYKNPEVDKLIDEARLELDKKKRIPLMRAIYKKIAEDVPYAFLFNGKYVLYAHSTKVAMPKPTLKYGVGTQYWWATAK